MLVSSVFPLTTALSLKLQQLVNIYRMAHIAYLTTYSVYMPLNLMSIASNYACLISVSANHSPVIEATAVSELL